MLESRSVFKIKQSEGTINFHDLFFYHFRPVAEDSKMPVILQYCQSDRGNFGSHMVSNTDGNVLSKYLKMQS